LAQALSAKVLPAQIWPAKDLSAKNTARAFLALTLQIEGQ
jgi:hypothetical protein